jgi:ATP-dependent helicase/DNAse subunit B
MNVPMHRSYSQMTTFFRCAHQYYLSKVVQVPEKPAVYLVAGNAVHELLEVVNHDLYQSEVNAG